ncbi:hypothetical protein ACO0QE_003766 [Hanseniaspora vineae]
MKTPPPHGYDKIAKTLDAYAIELKNLTTKNSSSSDNRKQKLYTSSNQDFWEISRLLHKRSRYIFDLFYKRKLISRELYQWCLTQGVADKHLIAKWKKRGYEKLCCVKCIQRDESNEGNKTCICRVPRATLLKQQQQQQQEKQASDETDEQSQEEPTGKESSEKTSLLNTKIAFKQCQNCGCSGCASTD